MTALSPHLQRLEADAIYILREGVAEANNPVILFSGGKDSTVLAHLALRAFHPASPPLPLLHIDSTWEFADVLAFRDAFADRFGFRLIVRANEDGRRQGINPFDHGSMYTSLMRTEALKSALTDGYDVVFGGARRDEEMSRAKERIVPSAMQTMLGIRANSVPNSGAASTGACRQGSRSVPFHCQTGPSMIFGTTSCCATSNWRRSMWHASVP